MKQFLESLKPELELAEKYDSYLAIENHSGNSLLNFVDSIKAFTDLNRHPRLGIALAPYHIQRNERIGRRGDQDLRRAVVLLLCLAERGRNGAIARDWPDRLHALARGAGGSQVPVSGHSVHAS